MAINKLPVNYKDDIINTEVNAHRRYKMTNTGEADVYEFEDKTEYIQKGNNYKAEDVNTAHEIINELVDLEVDSAEKVNGILGGTLAVPNAVKAISADNATKAGTATKATTATTANKATTAESVSNDFILINQQALAFTNGVCSIADARITANSLADVYFTAETKSHAEELGIVVNSATGKIELTAISQPSRTLYATIRVRVV